MIYERDYEGHRITFWPICSARALWLASFNYLLIDGRVAAISGGLCFKSVARAQVQHEGRAVPVEVTTKTSIHGLIHLDYAVVIDGNKVDAGTIRMSVMWKEPSDIEPAASAYAATRRR